MRIVLAFLVVCASLAAAAADETRGTVLAYDRQAHILILEDKTVWTLPATLQVPDDLAAGDVVQIEFKQSGDEGITKIASISREE